jgi:hypothetical protein
MSEYVALVLFVLFYLLFPLLLLGGWLHRALNHKNHVVVESDSDQGKQRGSVAPRLGAHTPRRG